MHFRLLAIAAFTLLSSQAQAAYMPDNNGRYVYSDHASRRAAGVIRSHRRYREVRLSYEPSWDARRPTRSHERRHHRRHRHWDRNEITSVDANGSPAYSTVHTANGLISKVATAYQGRFQGFIDAVEADTIPDMGAGNFVDTVSIKGNRISDIGCYARSGHMRHSKHYRGLACDIGQLRRDVTTDKFMYKSTAIAHANGLTDGCEWDNRDCGHIEVPGGPTRTASASRHHRHRHRYASR